MPGGVPVATMAIGRAGAKNAGIFAVQILAVSDQNLAARMVLYREAMAQEIEKIDMKLQKI